jgi:hypothetical protein
MSLFGHWQYKLGAEAEHNPAIKNLVQPVIEAFGAPSRPKKL